MANASPSAAQLGSAELKAKNNARQAQEEPPSPSPSKKTRKNDAAEAALAQNAQGCGSPSEDMPVSSDATSSKEAAIDVQASTAAVSVTSLTEIISKKVIELDAERLKPALDLLKASAPVQDKHGKQEEPIEANKEISDASAATPSSPARNQANVATASVLVLGTPTKQAISSANDEAGIAVAPETPVVPETPGYPQTPNNTPLSPFNIPPLVLTATKPLVVTISSATDESASAVGSANSSGAFSPTHIGQAVNPAPSTVVASPANTSFDVAGAFSPGGSSMGIAQSHSPGGGSAPSAQSLSSFNIPAAAMVPSPLSSVGTSNSSGTFSPTHAVQAVNSATPSTIAASPANTSLSIVDAFSRSSLSTGTAQSLSPSGSSVSSAQSLTPGSDASMDAQLRAHTPATSPKSADELLTKANAEIEALQAKSAEQEARLKETQEKATNDAAELAKLRAALEAMQALKETELAAFAHVAGSELSLANVVAATQDKNRSIVDAALELARLNKSLARTLTEMRKIVSPYHPYPSSHTPGQPKW